MNDFTADSPLGPFKDARGSALVTDATTPSPQGAGLLSFDFSAHPPVLLRAGRRYALTLQGDKGTLALHLRASRDDVYAGGEASVDDRPLKNPQGRPTDFAFALYARQPASP